MKVIDVEPAVVDGEERFLNTIKAPLKDAAGNVTGVVGFVHDITAQRKAQEEQQQLAAQLQEAMRAAQLANWQFDMATQSFTFNDSAYELLGTNVEAEGGYTKSLPGLHEQIYP